MDSEYFRDISRSRMSRRSSSSILSEESSVTSLADTYRVEGIYPPAIPVVSRRGLETSSIRRTNKKTGLIVFDEFSKNQEVLREQMLSRRGLTQKGNGRLLTSKGPGSRVMQGTRSILGALHLKIGNLATEIDLIRKECDNAQKEYKKAIVYEMKAKELAAEISNLQSNLAELNFVFDYNNTDEDLGKLIAEGRELEEKNNFEKDRLEDIFWQRKLKEDFVRQAEANKILEGKINQSSSFSNNDEKEKYDGLSIRFSQSSKAIEFWEKQIQYKINAKTVILNDLQKRFPYVNELIKFETELQELKKKYHHLTDKTGSKQTESQQLLETVTQKRNEIKDLEFKIDEINKNIHNRLLHVCGDVEYSNSKGELNYDFSNRNETENIKKSEEEIENLLKILQSYIPSKIDYFNLKEKKVELIDEYTDQEPEEYFETSTTLNKLEVMKFNLTQEEKDTDEKFNKLKQELKEFQTYGVLNTTITERENELMNLKSHLKEEHNKNTEEVMKAKKNLEKLKGEISDNKKHEEINSLEERWSCLEKNNKEIKEWLDKLRGTRTELQAIKQETLDLMETLNKHFIDNWNKV